MSIVMLDMISNIIIQYVKEVYFYTVSYYIKMYKTFWTFSTLIDKQYDMSADVSIIHMYI